MYLCTYVSFASVARELLTQNLPAPLKIEGKSVIPTMVRNQSHLDMTIGVRYYIFFERWEQAEGYSTCP
jgi:hypothetical protein